MRAKAFALRYVGGAMLGAVLLSYLNTAKAAEWLLAAREGGCAPVSILEKRGPEFRGIESPDQLVEKMRGAGEKVEVKEHKAGSRPAVEVRIPARNLYIMFVKSDFCGDTKGGKK